MGRLIDGEWSTGDLGTDTQGRYVRRAAKFRNRIGDAASTFPAEAGRYHLFVAYACGWSHRALIFRALKGLQDIISTSAMQDFMGEEGWLFESGEDPLYGKQRLYELYTLAQADYTGRASVPVLWDRQCHRIVSNESMDIIRSFDSAFDAFADNRETLFPDHLGDEIESMMQLNYQAINNGVYRCGFAASQAAYNEAASALFKRLELLDQLLAESRYLLGDRPTAADWGLFPTLYRFDSVYYIHFKCCLRQLREYRNLWAYVRDLYQQPGIADTCNMSAVRAHYYTSHESVHPRRYIPIGPEIDFDEPHGRDRAYT